MESGIQINLYKSMPAFHLNFFVMVKIILQIKENISTTVINESPAHNPSAPPMLDNMSNPL